VEEGLKFGPNVRFSTITVLHFTRRLLITEMEHPSYSPDLASNDLWLFLKIKSALKERRFQDIADIKKK